MRTLVGSTLFAAQLAAAFAATAAAQSAQRPSPAVRVIVQDSSGNVVPGAELTLTRGLHEVVARGTTDNEGVGTLPFTVSDSTDLEVTMRKIGFVRTDRFFSVGPHDVTSVTMVVARPKSSTLAPVVVTAEADVKRKSYYLSADDIENSDLPLIDGWDVVKRLRPDMLTSRGGCGTGVQNVWVNGQRIVLPLRPTGIVAARARVGVPSRARFTSDAVSVLSDILPEHIQEISYRDCFDHTEAVVGSVNAMYVVLKPGVIYQKNVGSFVLDAEAEKALEKKK